MVTYSLEILFLRVRELGGLLVSSQITSLDGMLTTHFGSYAEWEYNTRTILGLHYCVSFESLLDNFEVKLLAVSPYLWLH